MRPIRASEIATYIYCQRAWWYRLRGYESTNISALNAGQEMHLRHGRKVLVAGCLQVAASGLALLALVLLAVYITLQWLR